MKDNICAISTAYGNAAISIIRCSGPDVFNLINKIFKGKDLTKVKSHTINYGHIISNGEVIDEVLCNVYVSPHSFDGENMVEINCHGGVFVTNKILSILLDNGFRMAERGEFSLRAFLNNRMDLTSAEAIMDIIESENDIALKASMSSLRSQTKNLVNKFREKILDLLAKIEVNIDYPEYEDSVDVTHNYLSPILDELIIDMKRIIDNSSISKLAIHGVNTAIIGKPNVGKSSILNMMLDESLAIVSDIPGTTRDLVRGKINIGNVTLNLIDTAGIHDTADYVESIGIERSKKAIADSDLVLLVLDGSQDLDKYDLELLELTNNKKRIIIINKNDIDKKFDLKNSISISALKNSGMDLLANKITEITSINTLSNLNGNYLNNIRQVDLMKKAYKALINAKKSCDDLVDISLIEIDIKEAFDDLGEITGEGYPDELITALFTKFCLGK